MNQTEVEGNIRLEIVVTPSEGPECQQGEAMSLIQIATYQLSHSTVLNSSEYTTELGTQSNFRDNTSTYFLYHF